MSSKQQLAVVETTGRINVRAVYRKLWSLKKSIPVWCCAFCVSIFISLIAAVSVFLLGKAIVLSLPQALKEILEGELDLIADIANVSVLFFSPFFTALPVAEWGIARLCVNLVDGNGKFSDLLDLLRLDNGRLDLLKLDSGRMAKIVKFFLFQIAFTLLSAPGVIIYLTGTLLRNPMVAACGLLFQLIWNLFVVVRFQFVYFLMVDQGFEGIKALKQSWRKTKNQWIRIATLGFFIPTLVFMALLFTVGVFWGVFWGAVLISISILRLTIGIAYRQVVPKPNESLRPSQKFEAIPF